MGHRVARRWKDAGDRVIVVTRSLERARQLAAEGLIAIVADIARAETLAPLSDLADDDAVDTLLFAVGFDRRQGGSQTIREVYEGGLQNVLSRMAPDSGRVIYISTTGVYGNAGGARVDESTRPDPQRDGGRASLAAEEVLVRHPLGRNAVILRLAGLYGPGRIPYLEALRRGEPLAAPSRGTLNLIHVEDAAATVLSAQALPSFTDGPRIYCVSDGNPVERGEFYREIARRIGSPEPTFVPPEAGSSRAARAQTDRRIDNRRMREALQVSFTYPDYRAGLNSILSHL